MATAQVFGSIDAFNPNSIEWEIYETKFDFYVEANEIPDDRKKALLLASLGMVALSYVKNFNSPTSLKDNSITYDTLIGQLREHYGRKINVLAERTEFNNLRQKENQRIEEYAASLCASAVYCDFARDLDVRLRDQLVCDVLNDSIRKRLMKNDKCSFADARKRTNDLERIARDSKVKGGAEKSVFG